MDPAQAGTAGMDPAQAGAAGLGRAGAAAAADADLAGAGTAGVDPAQTAAVGAVVADATGTGPARADGSLGEAIGLVAARRALRMTGQPGVLASPLVIEITPAGNIAAGSVPWGLSPWLPEGSVVRVPSRAEAGGVDQVRRALRGAQARSVIAVVRDAHRDPGARALVTALLAERPDAVLVEMGLPVWRPRARAYLATYGASRASGQAAAEALGLTAPPTPPPP
jgi:beta-N-acetylhexosaminidase